MTDEKLLKLADEFQSTLLKDGREGMEDLILYLRNSGFYEAPCSTQFHLSEAGGLLQHSINVLHAAEKISVALYGSKNLTRELKNSIAVCALLHDVGKIGQFDKLMYKPNVLKSGTVSESKPYVVNADLMPVDHEIRSVILISMFIDLTEDEQFSILYHNGLYSGTGKYNLQGKETPLQMIIHWSDMWACRVMEDKNNG